MRDSLDGTKGGLDIFFLFKDVFKSLCKEANGKWF